MKKIIISVIITLVFAAAGYFGYGYMLDKNITDSSHWKKFYNDEFSVVLPKNMESSDKLFHTSDGQKQIAFYHNSRACFSVAKLPYSVNAALKDIDIEKYFSKITVNGEHLTLFPINGGFYYTSIKKSSGSFKKTEDVFEIEGAFKGKTAVYSVVIQCRLEDKDEYEDPMLKWLESFELKG